MLILDRVFCDCCGQFVGQLFNAPVQSADLLPDLTTAPDFVTCPDCERENALIDCAA